MIILCNFSAALFTKSISSSAQICGYFPAVPDGSRGIILDFRRANLNPKIALYIRCSLNTLPHISRGQTTAFYFKSASTHVHTQDSAYARAHNRTGNNRRTIANNHTHTPHPLREHNRTTTHRTQKNQSNTELNSLQLRPTPKRRDAYTSKLSLLREQFIDPREAPTQPNQKVHAVRVSCSWHSAHVKTRKDAT